MADDFKKTGLQCLELLFSRFRQGVNFAALVTDSLVERLDKDELDALMFLAEGQELRPEKASSSEVLTSYRGPAMIKLNNGSWILLINSNQYKTQDKVAIYDPAMPAGRNSVVVPKEQLNSKLGDTIIIFHNLAEVDITKHTKLYAFSRIASHHNVRFNLQSVMHEYAVGEEEVKDSLLKKIASDFEFKTKKLTLSWEKLEKVQNVFPALLWKKNGKAAILCGCRKTEESTTVAVIDPETSEASSPNPFLFLTREQFEETYTYDINCFKKTYHLADENRPFSLAWFIPEFIRMRGIFWQITVLVASLTVLSLAVPLFFQIVVDKVLVNRGYDTLNVIGAGVVIAILFNGTLEFAKSYLLLFATNKIDISTATKTFLHLMKLPIDFFERIPSGVLLKHMQQTEKIRGFLSGNLFFTMLDLLSLVLFIPLLLCYSVKLTLVVLGFSALMALVIASLIKPFQRRLDELYQAEGRRQSMLVEAIHGIRTVKSLALEPVQKKAWNDSTAYAIKSYFRVGKISMTARSMSQVLELLMGICVIWLGAHMVFDFEITIGALIAFQMLANRVTGPLVKTVGLIHEYQQIALSVKMLGVVMNYPSEPAGGGVRNPVKGEVSFENITFQYRPDLPQVLKNFSLRVPVGTSLGIVGRSGSGKTTLTKLLQGLYPVTQGLIKIDGIDIKEIEKSHLRSSIGVVLQENYFFSGTVRENIALTKQNATLEEVIYAAKLAGADEFVQKLPRGYDTVLEENASNLSGGQKQRLAIARALLTNPPILIFDEATSALDPESECVIQQNLKAISRGRTVLIISHRLSIVSHADNIVVIDSGTLSDTGNHKELLSRDGIYKEFWTQQMRGDA